MNDYQKKIIDHHILLYTNGLHETLSIINPVAARNIYTEYVFKALNPNIDNIKRLMYEYYRMGIYPEIVEHVNTYE